MAKKIRKEEWYVYILLCKKGTLYTGITKDVDRRYAEHVKGSARYTRYNPPVKILHVENVSTRALAMKREREIKRWPPKKKWNLINGVATG